jgi:SlyX protein
MNDSVETRLVELEIRLAHQDDLLQTLNRTITEQQQTIETLRARVDHLSLVLMEALQALPGDPSQEPPPPHY